jgi:hypothetical protein
MSDFEINLKVAHIALGKECYEWNSDKKEVYTAGIDGGEFLPNGYFDPCNNPADAWPIIVANHITIEWNVWKDGITRPYCHGIAAGTSHFGFDGNPLRAAMLAFLAMKESSNANPI